MKINPQEDILQNSEFLQKNGRGRWCDTYVQNSAFYQNSGRIGYICKQPVFGNVFVLTQAKMYLQKNGGFYTIAFYAKIENSCKISQALKTSGGVGHLLQNLAILI